MGRWGYIDISVYLCTCVLVYLCTCVLVYLCIGVSGRMHMILLAWLLRVCIVRRGLVENVCLQILL